MLSKFQSNGFCHKQLRDRLVAQMLVDIAYAEMTTVLDKSRDVHYGTGSLEVHQL